MNLDLYKEREGTNKDKIEIFIFLILRKRLSLK